MNRNTSPSSSEETTATSAPKNGFICTLCFKVFPTGQALGGHQNAHILERSFKQTTPNILAAVLNHPLPQDDDNVPASILARSNTGRGLQHRPPIPVQQQQTARRLNNVQEARRGGNGDTLHHHHPLEGRVKYGSPHFHPYERRSSIARAGAGAGAGAGAKESHRRRRLTKNLLSGWKPMNEVKEGEMMHDPNDDLELELSLNIKECVDLNLKLGF